MLRSNHSHEQTALPPKVDKKRKDSLEKLTHQIGVDPCTEYQTPKLLTKEKFKRKKI